MAVSMFSASLGSLAGQRLSRVLPALALYVFLFALFTRPSFALHQEFCPRPCVDFANVHGWGTVLSLRRLSMCQSPVIVRMPSDQLLDSDELTAPIRACMLPILDSKLNSTEEDAISVELRRRENPKLSLSLHQPSTDVAPACLANGSVSDAVPLLVQTLAAHEGANNVTEILAMLEGMQRYFQDVDNCDERTLIAYYNGNYAGFYIGDDLGKPTAHSSLQALIEDYTIHDEASGHLPQLSTLEICDQKRAADSVLGVVVQQNGSFANIQKHIRTWKSGRCILEAVEALELDVSMSVKNLTDVDVLEIGELVSRPQRRHRSRADGHCDYTEVTAGDSCGTLASRCRIQGADLDKFNRDKKGLCSTLMPGDFVCCSEGKPYSHPKPKKNADGTCSYKTVKQGEGCPELSKNCRINGQDLEKFNKHKDKFCSTLMEGDYVCCSDGKPYAPPKPRKQSDGTCATHIIKDGDTCGKLASENGITVKDIEKWNKGKTWAWTGCGNLMKEYNMCLSDGTPPLPPPQEDAECGPLKKGTKPPGPGQSLADLNPCPLNACCSNWGFCGVMPNHCQRNAPKDGGPGAIRSKAPSTCISNCGTEIKINSDKSAGDSGIKRIGYYESWNRGRDCLWLTSEDVASHNYDIVHWSFLGIENKTWKPIIDDPYKEWAGFKGLKAKKIGAFGGWAYSTQPATYNIMRQAIIDNADTFVDNIVNFVEAEGLDGIDIDWEYPGATDILANGVPIGKDGDGEYYLRFLQKLKGKMGDRLVAIAAPASYWYLKAFPIKKISETIDYIVYMTYDLHGQWDYSNPNSFDQCDSGKCIRSHVNFTETANSLAMITKAGVANNKIYVGAASYGRSFQMAQNGCWQPHCEFTGSMTTSKAKAGRCTKEKGYLALAEIEEIKKKGGSDVKSFYDESSASNILLYGDDYVSYLDVERSVSRRLWASRKHFAGSVEWAADLKHFTPKELKGEYGEKGKPFNSKKGTNEDDNDRAPNEIKGDENDKITDGWLDRDGARKANSGKCTIYKTITTETLRIANVQCYNHCRKKLEGTPDDEYKNYGCVGPRANEEDWEKLPWYKGPGGELVISGKCECNNEFVNELAEIVVDSLPALGAIACHMFFGIFETIKTAAGLVFPPGRAISESMDMAITGAKTIKHIYDDDNDPIEAFGNWLSPCDNLAFLLPRDLRKAFDTLNKVNNGIGSFKKPKNIPKGSGKKGDGATCPLGDIVDGNNKRANKCPTGGGSGGGGGGGGGRGGGSGGNKNNPKCDIKGVETLRMASAAKAARNTLQIQSCKNDVTQRTQYDITSVTYDDKAEEILVTETCSEKWGQACYHYSSAIRKNPRWESLTCPQEAATTARSPSPKKGQKRPPKEKRPVVESYSTDHRVGWWSPHLAAHRCQVDEYPPLYLLSKESEEYKLGGKDPSPVGSPYLGQVVRLLPGKENGGASEMWRGQCFIPVFDDDELSDADFLKIFEETKADQEKIKDAAKNIEGEKQFGKATVTKRPVFSINDWEHTSVPGQMLDRDGLWDNPCWPKDRVKDDPGFALVTQDPFYADYNIQRKWNYKKMYVKGVNGD